MGLYLDLKSKSENINGPAFSGHKVKVYMGDDAFGGEETVSTRHTPLSSGDDKDAEVNITGSTNSGKGFVVGNSCEDVVVPECSSSFGDTDSGTESVSFFSDNEVESQMCFKDPSSSMCGDWCESCQRRKKRMTKSVTVHWRRFIRPIMWRCKWIELKLKQLQSQAHKYEKELAAYNYTKQLDFAHLTLDDSDIKSVPISGRMHRTKVMKRSKRKRVEEKCHLASYMSNHSLFSYYEKTDCTADACLKDYHGVGIGGHSDNNDDNFKLNDVWSSGYYDNLDNSLDDIIQKIEAIQSQVQQLKSRTDTVMSENTGKFCSVTQSSMREQSDGFNHFDLTSIPFNGNGGTFPFGFPHSSSQLQSEFHMGDLPILGNALASHEGIIRFTENTDRPELDDPWEDTKDGVLTQNQEELHSFENVENHLVERTTESVEEDISEVQVSNPDSIENAVHNENSTLKSCSTLRSNIPMNKRKRGKKSGSKR